MNAAAQPFRPAAALLPAADAPVAVTDLFKIGIGPSSSHTIGPMRAANTFVTGLGDRLADVARLTATAFGSLAWTGSGHATDKAMILGLAGLRPDSLDPDEAESRLAEIRAGKVLPLPDGRAIRFDPAEDVVFDRQQVFDRHPNAMRFQALDTDGRVLASEVWFSVGGGFVIREGDETGECDLVQVPHPYQVADELLSVAEAAGLSIADLTLENEAARRPRDAVIADIDRIAETMFACIDRGLQQEGELSGGLRVKRRAKRIFERLEERRNTNDRAPHAAMDYVSVFAIAVNEENAAGGRVVTAPTNGAAGVVPAVLRYYRDFCPGADRNGIRTFFLAAAAIGGLIKRNASISGAEVGCQGEVGSAAAMAAAGLCAALGGTNAQVENAAEIAIEHHLGMTCDPVGGLVQIPCIERNAFGAIKAINAASLALHGDGEHIVSLDTVIETMRQTGLDMQSKYKETSLGGLAVNVTAC
ncbi:L-serine ammonia-lyase [Chthonobacter rhizosphaerae]|uniref:L-serine ammonia-lyase n=1 Tax=Chthonobacter rhizosphaerae TaxID=2735553 RepID=UPI0015EEA75B|nr:L-serine ammonia-lyase [Chthonobacter rhizosphaerae]